MACEHLPQSSTLHIILQSCFKHFSIVDFVRISASSKAISILCKAEVASGNRLLAHQILRKTISNAAESAAEQVLRPRLSRRTRGHRTSSKDSNFNLEQVVKAINWLLQVAGSRHLLNSHDSNPLAVETVTALIQTRPCVPLALAKALVASGLRVTYPQLFSAACSNPKGLSVWVKAHQRLRVPAPLPAYMTNICCGWSISEERIPSDLAGAILADTLFLAIQTAASATQLSRISHLCQHPAAGDIDSHTLAQLLHAAVIKQCSFISSSRKCSAPAGQQQGHEQQQQQQDDDEQLLLGVSSYSQGQQSILSSLCSVAAAKRLTPSQAAAVLQVAAEAAGAAVVEAICTQLSTVVRYLSAEAVTDLLLCIAKEHKYRTAHVAKVCAPLCALPAMQQLDSHAVMHLFKQMIQLKATGVVHALCGIPVARRLQQQAIRVLITEAQSAWGASSCALSGISCSEASEGVIEGDTVGIAELQSLAEVCGCL